MNLMYILRPETAWAVWSPAQSIRSAPLRRGTSTHEIGSWQSVPFGADGGHRGARPCGARC